MTTFDNNGYGIAHQNFIVTHATKNGFRTQHSYTSWNGGGRDVIPNVEGSVTWQYVAVYDPALDL